MLFFSQPMKKALFKIIGILLLGSLNSCNKESKLAPDEVEGYKPIYIQKNNYSTSVNQLAPRSIEKPGKIYTYNNYLFVGEKGKGVHIFNNADPSNPVALSFLEILGNNDVAVKNSFLYADSAGDLLVFDISNPNQIAFVSRLKDAIPNNNIGLLPPEQGYFECVDNSKGIVIGWEKTTLRKPKCRN